MFSTSAQRELRNTRVTGIISNHKSKPFELDLDGKLLYELHTVQELLDLVVAEHEASCSCGRGALQPRVWLCANVSTARTAPLSRRAMQILVPQKALPKDDLARKARLHFIVDFQLEKRQRSLSPGINRRLVKVEQLVYRVVDRKMRRISQGNGDWYNAVQIPGTTVYDTTMSLESFQAGSLLRGDSKLCLVYASSSPYMATHVSSLLSYFHDVGHAGDWAAFCQPLGMVQRASTRGVATSPSTHACIVFDFGGWAEPLQDIPKSFNMPAVPERLASFERSLVRHIRLAIVDFAQKYAAHLKLPDLFKQIKALAVLPAFFTWVKEHATQYKLFVVVRNLHLVLGRSVRASTWQGHEACSLADRTAAILQRLIIPIRTAYSEEDSVVQKLLFTGAYLPEHITSAGLDNVIDLSSVSVLAGLTPIHVRGGFRSIITSAQLDHCNVLATLWSAERSPMPFYSPETAQAVALGLDDPQVATRTLGDHWTSDIICKSYIDDNFNSAASMLFPLLLRNAEARGVLSDLLPRGGSVSGVDISLARTKLAVPSIISGSQPQVLFLTRCLLLGLLARERPPGQYKVAGTCAHRLLAKIRNEVFGYSRKYSQRPRPYRVVGRAPLPALQLHARDIQMLDPNDITEQALADMFLNFYRPAQTRAHPSNQPRDEHEYQGDFMHLLRAIHLNASPTDFVSDVQDEITVYFKVVEDVKSGRMDMLYLRRLPNGKFKLYIFELKYFNPQRTADATREHVPGLPSAAMDHWSDRYTLFLQELASIVDLPRHWYRDPSRIAAKLSVPLRLEDIRCFYEVDKTSTSETVDNRPAESANAAASTDAAQPDKKDYAIKNPIDVARDAVVQGTNYRDGVANGVEDAVPVSASSLAVSNPGLADWRITDMGPGETEIVTFIIVNVAGTLFFVKKLSSRVINRQLGFVDVYPWTPLRTKEQTDAIYDAMKAYKPPKD